MIVMLAGRCGGGGGTGTVIRGGGTAIEGGTLPALKCGTSGINCCASPADAIASNVMVVITMLPMMVVFISIVLSNDSFSVAADGKDHMLVRFQVVRAQRQAPGVRSNERQLHSDKRVIY